MTVLRYRTAVAPLRRVSQEGLRPLPTVAEAVRAFRPDEPMHCLRPQSLAEQADRFVRLFPGDVLYAVKCNPEPSVLSALRAGGIRHFDAASLGEVRLVRELFPTAEVHFMHPVKSRPAIRAAYFDHGVRDFVLDSADELAKILEETDGAADLGLIVRLALPKGPAVHDLSGKFGAPPEAAAALLRACRATAPRVGLSFHVGSQCMAPAAYERALELAGRVIGEAGVPLDVLDVGGGFPVGYADADPPPLEEFLAAIERAVTRLALPSSCRLWCEPGRTLVAAGQSVVVQVLARRGNGLFITDGVYGALSDAGPAGGFRFPVRLLPADDGRGHQPPEAFEFLGPSCDSADRMRGPFLLPGDVREGDWVEIGQLGAYGTALRTGFNGFEQAMMVEVRDRPLIGEPAAPPMIVRAA